MTGHWKGSWFSAAAEVRRDLWRGVEAQHVVSTMRLVDSVQEQELLERLLDASKPPAPQGSEKSHYVVFTPFRYRSPQASRFRRPDQPGAFYGADEAATVAAELGYWRRRFLADSDGLRTREVHTMHTFFVARFRGAEIDIMQRPWSAARAAWRDPADYSACQGLADDARKRDVASIRYESARREGHACNVVFAQGCLSVPQPGTQQTWTAKVTATKVIWAHDDELLEFEN